MWRRLLALAVLSSWAVAAHAAIQIERQMSSGGIPFLVLSGEFSSEDDVDEFSAVARSHKALFVTFDSVGGNVASAIRYGRAIRTLGLHTVQTRSVNCMSACALAFVGGVARNAEAGAIGVHQHSFGIGGPSGRDDAVAVSQLLTADVIDYLKEMDVDTGLLALSFRYDSNDMRFLSTREMSELKVTNVNLSGASTPAPQQESPTHAEVLLPTPAPPQPEPLLEAGMPSNSELTSFVKGVLSAHSQTEMVAIRQVVGAYGSSVTYFGKVMPLNEVLVDKRAYFQRWPERTYLVREPTVTVSCILKVCDVRGVMDWSVRSLPRNRKASGSAAFRYSVDVSNGMRIIGEDSRILE